MENSFPVIISSLRKARGLSQKEAAEKLGVSQALLSHYEKGIRECGQSFLVRIADFYEVSVDYLLGREFDPARFRRLLATVDANGDEWNQQERDLLRTAIQLRNRLSAQDPALADTYEGHLAVLLYHEILQQVRRGNLPKSWAGVAFTGENLYTEDFYLQMIDLTRYPVQPPMNSQDDASAEETVPEAVRAVVDMAEEYIFSTLAKHLPPIPPKYLK